MARVCRTGMDLYRPDASEHVDRRALPGPVHLPARAVVLSDGAPPAAARQGGLPSEQTPTAPCRRLLTRERAIGRQADKLVAGRYQAYFISRTIDFFANPRTTAIVTNSERPTAGIRLNM